jgi:hypothetical protein
VVLPLRDNVVGCAERHHLHLAVQPADDEEIVLASRTLERQSTLRETLRHEILHASLDIAGISHLTVYQEEAIVRCIDNIFHPAWDKVRKQLTTLD